MSINVISANEINENNLDGISTDSYDAAYLDSAENTEQISAENTEQIFSDSNIQNDNLISEDSAETNTENLEISANDNYESDNNLNTLSTENENANILNSADQDSDNQLEATPSIKTNITIKSTSVLRGTQLYVFLKDANGNAIANKKLALSFNNKIYNRTTDDNGRVGLMISSAKVGRYNLSVAFHGDSRYIASNQSFAINVYQIETHMTVNSKTIIRGNYLYIFLRNSTNQTISGKNITITFRGTKYTKTTNSNGRACLKISSAPEGKYSIKINFTGTTSYAPSNRSFTLTVKRYDTHISVNSKTIVKGNRLIATLRNSTNQTISGKNITITFRGTKYTKTTDNNGRVSLLISSAPAGKYSIKINFSGSTSYAPSSRSFTLTVITKGGSGVKITQKTIIINSDNIINPTKDKKYMNDLATALRAKGYKVIVTNIGPNEHCNDIMGKYSNSCILCLFGGADSGMFVDMGEGSYGNPWYQNLLKQYKNRVVLGFEVPPNIINLANCTYLVRAHDDDYSPDDFAGLAYPGKYLNSYGMDYIYGRNPTEMANNFVTYAVNGASIGLNNTSPLY